MEEDNNILKILIIEDDENHLDLIIRGIRNKDNKCIIKSTDRINLGKSLIKEFNPDIAIVDWMLPDGYGTDFLKISEKNSLPVIIMTSFGNESVAVDSIKMGALDYIVKSTDTIDGIYHVITRAIREWNHIIERKKAETELLAFQKKIETLYKLAIHTSQLNTEEELYNFIGSTIGELIPNSIVFVNKIDNINRKLYNVSRYGDNSIIEKIQSIVGFSLNESEFDINFETYDYLKTGKLTQISGGLFEFLFKRVPTSICRTIENLINIKEIYSIGFVRNNTILGNASIIINEEVLDIDKTLIETFTNQISIAIQRKTAESELLNLNQELSEQRDKFKTLSSEYFLLNEELKYKNYALRASEEKYRILIERMNEGLITADNDDIIQYVNRRACEILEFSSNEIIGKKSSEIIALDEDKRIVQRKSLLRLSNIADNYELRMNKKNGDTIWVLMSGSPIFNKDGKVTGSIGIFTDITQKKKAEKQLIESENRLQSMISSSPDIICFKDGEGRWLIANDYDLKLFQLENVDYKGKKDSELANYSSFYKDAFLACEDSDELTWKTGALCRVDETIPCPDGSSKVFDIIKIPTYYEDGRRKGLIVFGRDITERSKIESDTKKQNELLESFIKNLPFDFWILDNDGKVAIQSDNCIDNWGLLISQHYEEIEKSFSPKFPLGEFIKEANRGKVVRLAKELIYKEQKKSFHFVVAPIVINDRVIGTLFINFEIDSDSQKLSDVEQIKEKAFLSYFMKTDFLANISYELRNPMNSILGFLELLLKNKDLNKEQLEFLNVVKSSSNNLFRIIEEFLDFSLIQSDEFILDNNHFNLLELFQEIVDKYSEQISDKGLIFKYHVSEECTSFYGDRYRINQILNLLLKNSIKFTPQGLIELNIYKNKVLKIVVKDTGVGIPEDKIKDAYTPFFQVEDPLTKTRQGIGFSLTIIKLLVNQMGGDIEIQSKFGEGTTIIISLPFLHYDLVTEQKEMTELSQANSNDEKKEFKILIVEDDSINIMFLKKCLELINYQTDEASNGEQAIDKFINNDYDLIFMDLELPVMNGIEATQEIRKIETQTNTHIPIIALTAYSYSQEFQKCMDAGMDGFLSKPIEISELNNTLNKYIKR